jgi:hypothetical protein
MVSTILKVLGEEAAVGTVGNNFNGKTLIRVYNNTASDVSVLVKDAAVVTTGSFTLRSYETAFVTKLPAESIFGSATIRMVPVAF